MPRDGTRELIARRALELFSDKGFAAVSMRDIAGAAGIRASTIYHYFESKRDLIDAMIGRAEDVTNGLKSAFFEALDRADAVRREPFVRAGVGFVTGYLRHEEIQPLLRMLESERFHDPSADAAWREMLIYGPLAHEEKVFTALAARGAIARTDAAALAHEYHGIVLLGYFTGDIPAMADALGSFYDRVFLTKGGDGT